MRVALYSILFAGLAGAQTTPSVPSYKELKYPPLPQVKIPEVATFTLPNGMKLYLLENHELPLVSGFALVRTGNLFEPADKVGLAQITGTVLRSGGTKARTGDEIDVQLENIAASIESGIGETSGSVSFSCLRENTDEVLGLFQQIMTAPEFRQDKIDLIKTQLRGAIARRNDNAGGIAGREFNDIVYGKTTPYGRRMEYEHLDRIEREDLIAFYKRYFFPANIMLAVTGDFETSAMKAKLEKLFGAWDYRQQPVPPFPEVEKKPSPGVFLAVKNDVNQTFFHAGHLGGLLKDKDYPALEVMADILGGGFSSRLFAKVRTQLGYAYSVRAGWGAGYQHPGLFQVSGSTKSQSTTETLQVIREEIERIRTQEVTDQELATARDTVLNGFVFNFDRPGKTLNRLVIYEYYGYPKDFIFQYQKAVEAVTKADVLRVAKEHLRPDAMTIVAVGKPDDFGKPLTALNLPVTPIDLTIPEPKQAAARSDAASLEQGRQLLQRVQRALGGAEKLAALKDSISTSETEIQTGTGALKAKQINRWVAPSHVRQDQELPFGKIIAYYDGSAGWLSTPQGVQQMPPPVIKQVEGQMFRLMAKLVLSDREPDRMVNQVGDGTLEISDKSGNRVRLQVDEKTGLPAKIMYQGSQMGGAPVAMEEVYSDWKAVDGIQVPHKVTSTQGGRKYVETTVQEVKLNSGLQVEELSRKP